MDVRKEPPPPRQHALALEECPLGTIAHEGRQGGLIKIPGGSNSGKQLRKGRQSDRGSANPGRSLQQGKSMKATLHPNMPRALRTGGGTDQYGARVSAIIW